MGNQNVISPALRYHIGCIGPGASYRAIGRLPGATLRADIHATIGAANIRPPKLFAIRGRYMIPSGRSQFAPRNSRPLVWRFTRPSGRGEFAPLNFSPVPARSDKISRKQSLRKERPLVPLGRRKKTAPPLVSRPSGRYFLGMRFHFLRQGAK